MTQYVLEPHQAKAVRDLSNGKILVGGVGSGKSFTAASYYVANESPKDVYVITTAKKRDDLDWEKEFVHVGVGTERDGTLHGVLKVDSWNNIARYTNVKNAFFLFDEQRLVGSGAWVKAFQKIAKSNRWIMLSATPGDIWLDYIPVFVANGFYKNKTEFINEHVQYVPRVKHPKVQRYLNTGRLVRHRNSILVEMPMERHTTRHLTWVNCGYDATLLEEVTKKRWNVLEKRPLRDVAELFRVARVVVNSDTSRLDAVRQLMLAHPRLIVFYNFNYELEMLRTLTESDTSVGADLTKPVPSVRSLSPGKTTRGTTSKLNSTLTTSPQLVQSTSLRSRPTSSASRSRSSGCKNANPESLVAPSTSTTAMSGTSSDTPATRASASEASTATTSTTERRTECQEISTSTTVTMQKPGSGTDQTQSRRHPVRTVDVLDVLTDISSQKTKRTTSSSDGTSRSSVQMAEWNGHKHEPVPTSERWVYLVQYTAGSEGWNCTDTDAMVFYSLTYSYKNWHQAFGRIDRMNTQYVDLYYYALVSKSWIDLAIRKALSAKKSFNESSFKSAF